MKRSILILSFAVCGVLGLSCISRAGDTIYQDNFDGTAGDVGARNVAVASGLDGGTAGAVLWNAALSSTDAATITSTTADAAWVASGGTYSGTGSTNASAGAFTTGADSNLIANAYVPFVPQSGYVYDVHLAIAPSGVGASGNWLGLAFAAGSGSGVFLNDHSPSGTSSALSNDSTTGLIILKGSGAVQSFGSTVNTSGQITSSTANGEFNTAAGFIPTGTTSPTYTAVDLDLDTTGSQWIVSWSLNGATSGADFASYTYPAGDNPTTIAGIIFGTNKLTGDVSDFSVTTVPEPASLSLLILGGLAAVRRRNRA